MQKVLFSFFVGLGYALQLLKRPATWGILAALAALLWWRQRSAEAAKVVHRHPPIEFKAITPAPAVDPTAAPVEGASPELSAAVAEGITDPEQLPVMSSRDLEVAVGRFHKDNLRLPRDAEELIAQKYLVGVPPAPPGKRYMLDLSPIKLRLVRK